MSFIIHELFRLAENIPAVLWGVVIGSFFSLGGIVLTNRANDRRLQKQLAHDQDLKNRDRELSLRKDIYLAAADAISAGLVTVGQFANLDIAPDKLTERYVEKSSAIAKVHIIAKQETAMAVATLTGELSAAYLRLFTKRIPLMAQKQQLAFLKDQLASFAKERDRMLDLMKQHNLEGVPDQRRWNVIRDNFEFEQERIAKTTTEHNALAAELYTRQLNYMQECIAESIRLSRLLVPVLIAVRTELCLPIDEVAYMQVVDDGIKTPSINVAYYFNNVNKVPTLEKIQNELSSYVNNNLNSCLKDFADFKKQGWDVEKGTMDAKTQINKEDVTFEVDFPIKVSNKENAINFEKFVSKLNVRLKYIYELASKIVDFSSNHKRHVDMTSLNDYDVDVTVIDYEGSLIYNIRDFNSLLMGQPYVFRFAVK